MKGTLVIYRRELAGLFYSPLAWILLFVSLLLMGALFAQFLSFSMDVTASLELTYGGSALFWVLTLILAPLLTMRLLAEEAANGTLEYLRTAPVSDAAVVTGKFLAGTSFLALLWASCFLYAGALHVWGTAPDWGQVVATYIGMVLVSALFVAIGLVTSSLTNTPLIAAFLSFMGSMAWLLLPSMADQLLRQMRTLFADLFGGASQAEAWIRAVQDRMSAFHHFGRSYHRGVLDSSEVIFFLTWIVFFLFLTTRTLEARRWRG